MTPTQLFDYLAGAGGADTRRRMPRDEAAEWCRLRRQQKQTWIRQRMEDSDHGR